VPDSICGWAIGKGLIIMALTNVTGSATAWMLTCTTQPAGIQGQVMKRAVFMMGALRVKDTRAIALGLCLVLTSFLGSFFEVVDAWIIKC
jgi:hypothetical protein